MRRIAVLIAAVAVMTAATTVAFAAPLPKVNVCHFDADTGTFSLINISQNAFDAHIAHGDGAPGEPVPGMSGYLFDANCVPDDVGVTVPLRQRAHSGDTYALGGAVFGSATLDSDGGVLAVDVTLTNAVPSKLMTVWVVINGLWRPVDLQKFNTDADGNLSASLSLTLASYPAGTPPTVRVVVDNWYPGSSPLPYYGYASSPVVAP